MKIERQSNLELLRLAAMFFILIHHCIVHGLGLTALSANMIPPHISGSNEMLLFGGINSFCIVAVNVFVLISGYFGIKTTKEKVVSFLFQLFFYTILFVSIPTLLYGERFSAFVYSLLFVSKSPYWFVVVYLLLMGFAPLLNHFCEDASRKQMNAWCLFLIIGSCYCGFVWENGFINYTGYNLFQFITMYCIGRYIHKYELSLKTAHALIGFVTFSAITWLLQYYFYTKDSGLLYWTPLHLAWKVTYYNSPFIMSAAICLLLAFQNLHFQSKAINYLSASVFAVYLLQESYFGPMEYQFLGAFKDSHSAGTYLLLMLAFALFFFLLAFLIDPVRRWFDRTITRKLFSSNASSAS